MTESSDAEKTPPGPQSERDRHQWVRIPHSGETDEHTVAGAKLPAPTTEPRSGFEYVCDVDGYKLFRKRK